MSPNSPDNLSAAFKAYEQARYLRTARVQIMARVSWRLYHARGVTAELRDMAVGGRTTQQAYDGIAWLYGGPLSPPPRPERRAAADTAPGRSGCAT